MGNNALTDKLVPREVLIPIGAWGTAEFQKCADSWTDSEVAILRARLAPQYHAVPLDWLRKEFINIRKQNTPGYKLRGHGPSNGRYASREAGASNEYLTWIQSEEFGQLARAVKEAAAWRCQVCNSDLSPEAHHRTYDTMQTEEEIKDLICLCAHCHEHYHRKLKDLPLDLF